MLFSIKKREKSHMIQFVPILLLLTVILIFSLSSTQLTADNRTHERGSEHYTMLCTGGGLSSKSFVFV